MQIAQLGAQDAEGYAIALVAHSGYSRESNRCFGPLCDLAMVPGALGAAGEGG